jgi:alpha-amylase
VKGDIRKMKLAAVLLLTLPGQPYIYYGEEIGMLGPKPDPRIREAFLWSDHPEDPDLANWQPSVFSIPSAVTSLESQQKDPDSLYHHYKRLIQLRKDCPAIHQIMHPNLMEVDLQNSQLLAYIRTHSDQPVLVLNNLTNQKKQFFLPDVLQDFLFIYYQNGKKNQINKNAVVLTEFGTIILGKRPHLRTP